MIGKTPRGGDPKNSGRFSRAWGARKVKARQYALKAAKLRDSTDDRKMKRYYSALELEQRGKYRSLSEAEQITLQRAYMETMTPAQKTLFAGGTATAIGGLIPVATGTPQGMAIGTTMALAGEGALMTTAAIGNARRNKTLGISGFNLDGNLSNEESAAVNSVIGTISIVGAGGALFWANRRLGGQIGMIGAQKVGRLLGTTQVAKNIRPATTRNVASWAEMGDLSADIVKFAKPVDNAAKRAAEVQLIDDMANAGGNYFKATATYHGSPLVNPEVRAFHIEAARVLDIKDAMNWSHAKLGAVRSVVQASSVRSYATEIRIQYEATQRFLASQGVEYVDVVRGLGLSGADARRYGLKVITSMPKPGETPWVEMDALLPPLNSFSTSLKMSMNYALGRVVPVRGDVVVITRARVPREKVYSFSGLGPGHSAEVVVTGGDTPVQMIAVSKKFLHEQMRLLNLPDEESVLGTLWDVGLIAKRAPDIPRDKRIQAGLSLSAATLGLAALGSKGGAVATRAALKKAPQVAARLRLTPKGAEAADKASLGLVTVGSGVGGASGLHFANLQRKEAKQEERKPVLVKKDWDSQIKDHDRRRAQHLGRKDNENALKAGRFILVGQDPDDLPMRPGQPGQMKQPGRPAAPPRRSSWGGIDPEDRRQRRMKGEQWALGGTAAASGSILAGQQARNVASRRLVPKLEQRGAQRSKQAADSHKVWQGARRQEGKYKSNAAKFPKNAEFHLKQAANQGRVADNARKANQIFTRSAGRYAKGAKLLGKPSNKGALALAGITAVAGGGAYGMSRMRRGQGKHYSDWWDG